MEDEKFFTGYCRQIDRSRTVTAELEDGKRTYVDCAYESCVYRQNCPIGRQIAALEK